MEHFLCVDEVWRHFNCFRHCIPFFIQLHYLNYWSWGVLTPSQFEMDGGAWNIRRRVPSSRLHLVILGQSSKSSAFRKWCWLFTRKYQGHGSFMWLGKVGMCQLHWSYPALPMQQYWNCGWRLDWSVRGKNHCLLRLRCIHMLTTFN